MSTLAITSSHAVGVTARLVGEEPEVEPRAVPGDERISAADGLVEGVEDAQSTVPREGHGRRIEHVRRLGGVEEDLRALLSLARDGRAGDARA